MLDRGGVMACNAAKICEMLQWILVEVKFILRFFLRTLKCVDACLFLFHSANMFGISL